MLDAAWAPDGLSFAAVNVNADLLLFGMADAPRLLTAPPQQFWSSDSHALIHDANLNALDTTANVLPHRVPRGVLCDASLSPLADEFQRPALHDQLEPPGLAHAQGELAALVAEEKEREEAEAKADRRLDAATGGLSAANIIPHGKRPVGAAGVGVGGLGNVHGLGGAGGNWSAGGGRGGRGASSSSAHQPSSALANVHGLTELGDGESSPMMRVTMGAPSGQRAARRRAPPEHARARPRRPPVVVWPRVRTPWRVDRPTVRRCTTS